MVMYIIICLKFDLRRPAVVLTVQLIYASINSLTQLYSERLKLHKVLAILSAIGLLYILTCLSKSKITILTGYGSKDETIVDFKLSFSITGISQTDRKNKER